MRRNRKRIIAALLAGFMVFAEIPAQAFAEEVNEVSVEDDAVVIEQETEEIPDSEENLQEQEGSQKEENLQEQESSKEQESSQEQENLQKQENLQAKECSYEQEFLEEGVKVTLNDEEGVIPEQADVSITLIEENELEYIKGEIQNKMETVTAERMASSGVEDQTLFERYYDLTPVVEDAYAFDFEITYLDDEGNPCIFEPKEGQTIEVSIEADGLSDVIADEMCEAALFHNPDRESISSGQPRTTYGSGRTLADAAKMGEPELLTEGVVVSEDEITFDAEHFSVYTVAFVRYAASADSEVLAAQKRAWNIINTYVDWNYFLIDPYKSSMQTAQYEELRKAAENAVAGCTTQYDKIKAITEFVADRTYYDYKYLNDKEKNPTNIEPYKVYKERRAVCGGYSFLVRTLLISVGIPCISIHGNNHAYNAAYDSTNRRWIFVDATWCSKNKYTVDDVFQYGGYSTRYFDMPLEEIAKLTSHEVYSMDGLLDGTENSAYYRMETEHDTTLPSDDLIWRKGNWHLVVSGAKQKNVKAVSGFAGLEVRKVIDRAFDKNKELTKIDLSSTNIESIGYASFYECKSLKTVKVPPALAVIDGFAFCGCTKLKKMNLSSTKVKEVSEAAFQLCKSLKSVSFPAGLKKVEKFAFFKCSKLKEIDLAGTKVSSLGYAAFYGCNKAKSLYIPSTVKSIGKFAFGCNTKSNIKTSAITTLSLKKIGYSNKKKYIWSYREAKRSSYAYHIKFDGNGATSGTMKNMLCGGGMEYKLSSNQFKREGYRFTGWNTKKNGKGKKYKNKEKIKNLATKNGKKIKLYAQWKAK